MRKALLFSIMLAFGGASSVHAQVFPLYPSDALVVQQGLIQFNSCITGLPGCYSRYYYPGYSRGYYRKPPTKKERVLRVLGAAAIGGGYGYAITGTGEGALRGTGFGGAAGLTGEIVESYFGERAPAPRGRQVVYEQRRIRTEPIRPTRYEFRLRNESRFYREVYDGDDYIARMAPGEIWSVPLPEVRYQSWPVKPTDGGGWTYGDRELPTATETGWVFR